MPGQIQSAAGGAAVSDQEQRKTWLANVKRELESPTNGKIDRLHELAKEFKGTLSDQEYEELTSLTFSANSTKFVSNELINSQFGILKNLKDGTYTSELQAKLTTLNTCLRSNPEFNGWSFESRTADRIYLSFRDKQDPRARKIFDALKLAGVEVMTNQHKHRDGSVEFTLNFSRYADISKVSPATFANLRTNINIQASNPAVVVAPPVNPQPAFVAVNSAAAPAAVPPTPVDPVTIKKNVDLLNADIKQNPLFNGLEFTSTADNLIHVIFHVQNDSRIALIAEVLQPTQTRFMQWPSQQAGGKPYYSISFRGDADFSKLPANAFTTGEIFKQRIEKIRKLNEYLHKNLIYKYFKFEISPETNQIVMKFDRAQDGRIEEIKNILTSAGIATVQHGPTLSFSPNFDLNKIPPDAFVDKPHAAVNQQLGASERDSKQPLTSTAAIMAGVAKGSGAAAPATGSGGASESQAQNMKKEDRDKAKKAADKLNAFIANSEFKSEGLQFEVLPYKDKSGFGIVVSFKKGQEKQAEKINAMLADLGVSELLTGDIKTGFRANAENLYRIDRCQYNPFIEKRPEIKDAIEIILNNSKTLYQFYGFEQIKKLLNPDNKAVLTEEDKQALIYKISQRYVPECADPMKDCIKEDFKEIAILKFMLRVAQGDGQAMDVAAKLKSFFANTPSVTQNEYAQLVWAIDVGRLSDHHKNVMRQHLDNYAAGKVLVPAVDPIGSAVAGSAPNLPRPKT